MVGPWCFLDRYGPIQFTADIPMLVAPHPHIGIQTVSWLLDGEVLHKDSLGSEVLIHAGQLNLMTSGFGIAHSEETPKRNSGRLNGVQLWVALPDPSRNTSPQFDHYASLPELELGGASATLIAGTLSGEVSPARTFSPMVGADIAFHDSANIVLPLNRAYEHALYVFQGEVFVKGQRLDTDTLHYIGPGPEELAISGSREARLLLIGGQPFGEPILMWWNFVARSAEEIAQAREDWAQHRRFGEVRAYNGPRLSAPDLLKFAPPNPAS
jgi:redox-sensitive bicupin YhaK (pirin superfamily)